MQNINLKYFLFIFILSLNIPSVPGSNLAFFEQTGTLKGKILDAGLKNPISNVIVKIKDPDLQTISDQNGEYFFPEVPIGNCRVYFQAPGFKSYIKPEQLILPGKITILNVELVESKYQFEKQITVQADYFQKKEQEPLSQYNLDQSEIRHTAGSVEDISRVLNIFPGVSRVYEISNDLIVRGGSPFENGFYIDGILIPNVNYFQREGGSGGVLGIINPNLIKKTNFYTGAFSSIFGDRLSSIIDIQFRKGYKEKISSRFDLNLSGYGATVEGPLPGNRGSWIVSGKRSYVDILSKALDIGIAPSYGNIHTKLTVPLDTRNTLSLLDIYGGCDMDYGLEMALDNNINFTMDSSTRQNTIGMTWQHLWNKKGYMETSISHSYISNADSLQELNQESDYLVRDEIEQIFTLRNINFIRFNTSHKIEFGIDIKHLWSSFNNYYGNRLDRWGIPFSSYFLDGNFKANTGGVFISNILNLTNRLIMISGFRGDYFTFNRQFLFSPRLSFTYLISRHLKLNLGGGIFRQNLYPSLLARNPNSDRLKTPQAAHVVAGLEYSIDDSTKLILEAYDKEYRHMPVTPEDPELFILDNNVAYSGFSTYSQIFESGAANSRGVELFFQKKMKNKFFGIVSASFFKSTYRNYNRIWRDRLYDNRILITIVGRYRPNEKWHISLRWNFSGGIPYTPLDLEKSQEENRTVLSQEKILTDRYPAYHSLFLRADRRFYFKNSSLSIYISLLNAYNRKNVARYYWDRKAKTSEAIYHATLLPIFGIEYEF